DDALGGFNSATAQEPWRTVPGGFDSRGVNGLQFGHGPGAVENSRRWTRRSPPQRCFNSATAQKPWRTAAKPILVDLVHLPSIRPRPRSRGDPYPAFSTPVASTGFNSATAQEPWRTKSSSPQPPPASKLQFGHGPGAVENVDRQLRE